ncbi:uncharacterized protein DEA37_0000817 [Paragonimus westermani]|uniref:Reverse transcriptase domain-containing protein n=1 Tax=Paragonimus westermani TaxID=34504 RepID=A0A5J4NLB2_9TREM|nr:uncharacterized protein DEA37_0000817 [Paragonimus westermani]
MCKSRYHAAANCLLDVSEHMLLRLCTHNLCDSPEFVDSLKDINVRRGLIGSLVNSLFTPVPLVETNFCAFRQNNRKAWSYYWSDLKELLSRCTLNAQFVFNGQLSYQSRRVVMGSFLGLLLADVFMRKLESQLQSTIQNLHKYRWYLGDMFVIIQPQDEIESTFSFSMHNKLHLISRVLFLRCQIDQTFRWYTG